MYGTVPHAGFATADTVIDGWPRMAKLARLGRRRPRPGAGKRRAGAPVDRTGHDASGGCPLSVSPSTATAQETNAVASAAGGANASSGAVMARA